MLSLMIESRSALKSRITVQVNRHGHAADHEVRVRILAAKDGVDFG